MEKVIVLIWMATIGGEHTGMAVVQSSFDSCAENLDRLMATEQVLGPKINGEQSWMDVVDKRGKCESMTMEEFNSLLLGDS